MSRSFFVADRIQRNADPTLDSHIRRFGVDFRRAVDQACLRPRLRRNPDRHMPVVVVIVGKDREDLLPDKERRLAMRRSCGCARQRETDAAHTTEMVVSPQFSVVDRCKLLGVKSD